jgi:hypothetical protein
MPLARSATHAFLAASALVLAGCSHATPLFRAARAPFQPPRGDAIFAHAVEVLSEGGYALAACDADLGALATGAVELDVPCWGGSCLARQRILVKLGYRRARVIVVRERWDWSLKEWAPLADPALEQDVVVEEKALLSQIMQVPPPRMDAPRPDDPCQAGPCARGGCLGRVSLDPG